METSVESYDWRFDDRYVKINSLSTEAAREEALRLISAGSAKPFRAPGDLHSTPNPDSHLVDWDLQDFSPLIRELFSKYEDIFTDDHGLALSLPAMWDAMRVIPGKQTFLVVGYIEGGYEFLAEPGSDKIYIHDSPKAPPQFMANTIYHLILMIPLLVEVEDEDRREMEHC